MKIKIKSYILFNIIKSVYEKDIRKKNSKKLFLFYYYNYYNYYYNIKKEIIF